MAPDSCITFAPFICAAYSDTFSFWEVLATVTVTALVASATIWASVKTAVAQTRRVLEADRAQLMLELREEEAERLASLLDEGLTFARRTAPWSDERFDVESRSLELYSRRSRSPGFEKLVTVLLGRLKAFDFFMMNGPWPAPHDSLIANKAKVEALAESVHSTIGKWVSDPEKTAEELSTEWDSLGPIVRERDADNPSRYGRQIPFPSAVTSPPPAV